MKTEKRLLIGQLSEYEKTDFQKFFARVLPSLRKAWPEKTFVEPQEALKRIDSPPEDERKQYLWYLQSILDVIDLGSEYRKNLANILNRQTLPENDLHKLGEIHNHLNAFEISLIHQK
jgi:hypothetical protein